MDQTNKKHGYYYYNNNYDYGGILNVIGHVPDRFSCHCWQTTSVTSNVRMETALAPAQILWTSVVADLLVGVRALHYESSYWGTIYLERF
jgi:hypothetical protein